jgi:tritrans,polycis-undecaprenyl-diphosphate synthase [geranylgeranyl-diphosphate specific]
MKTTVNYPEHVLIIPDGNRRYAKANGLSLGEAYQVGASKITDMIDWILKEYDSTQLTIHGLSYDNVAGRDAKEIAPIVSAIAAEFRKWVENETIHEREIRVKVIGENERLSEGFQKAKRDIEDATRDYEKKELDVLIGYNGRREIMHVLEKIRDKKIMDDSELLNYMWVKKPIDMVIRTSNTLRLSNCPLYQINYAEFAFIEKCFPAVTQEDISGVMEDYVLRERRYGK